MKTLHFYVDKSVSFLFFTSSVALVLGGILIGEEKIDFKSNFFESCVLSVLLAFFIYGSVFYLFLLFRNRSLLTITTNHMLIHNMFKSTTIIAIANIKSFSIVNNNFKGITTTREIYIELKNPTEKFKRYWINRLLTNFNTKLANSQYSIHTNLLKIKQKDLLDILNERLEFAQQKSVKV